MEQQIFAFKTELKQLLDIIIHSLYSNKDVFLRELISNSSDALDKLRYSAFANPEMLDDDESESRIRISYDTAAGTLSVSDNGIGMNREEVVENLGTIAHSGSKEFLRKLTEGDAANRPELIGQFGVGFYAAFMVAKKVEVHTRKAGEPSTAGVRWSSDGSGSFTVEESPKTSRGTEVILHLKDDAKDFLDPWRLRGVVKKFSDFVAYPIAIPATHLHDDDEPHHDDGETHESHTHESEEVINEKQALWLRPKQEIAEEEYHRFYQHLTRELDNPLSYIHMVAEGSLDFRALLFIPRKRSTMWWMQEREKTLHLYVRRVFISDSAEGLLPGWLRFVKGLVDSSDLPLNVSRELLQDNPVVSKIRGKLVEKVLSTLEEVKKERFADYQEFFTTFGIWLKEGVLNDWERRQRLAKLLIFESSATAPGEHRSLEQYVADLPAACKEIYVVTGENRSVLEHSPYLEQFRRQNLEVLFLTDPADEMVIQALGEFDGRTFKAVNKGQVAVSEEAAAKAQAEQDHFSAFCDHIKGLLGDEVKEVRLSSRLVDSASCVVVEDDDPGAYLEKVLARMGHREGEPVKRILELNPDHPAVQACRQHFERDAADPRVADFGTLLYEQAVLAEGSMVKDPAAMAARINRLFLNGEKEGVQAQ